MVKIVFDCERMKYRNTGLFSYCFQLAIQFRKLRSSSGEKITFFIPTELDAFFGNGHNYILHNSLHKFYMPSLKNYDIWHSTYQNSEYVPVINKKIKVILTIHDLNFLYDDSKPAYKKMNI